ncbi:MAG TPA: hypothetical protein VFS07_01115, partial [Gemmatimonadales bacterium]|nr:hypothetical protein [Gemmatimonadales bacterium]
MNEAERRGAIVRALERLNPALAGLFRTAVSIIAEQPGPGDAFVIAVAGRTLLIGALTELGVL